MTLLTESTTEDGDQDTEEEAEVDGAMAAEAEEVITDQAVIMALTAQVIAVLVRKPECSSGSA